jgi:hypothetical protein
MAQVRLLPLQPAEMLNNWLRLADIHLLPQKARAAPEGGVCESSAALKITGDPGQRPAGGGQLPVSQ